MNVILSIDNGTTTIGALALDVDSGETLLAQSVANAANAAGSPARHHQRDARVSTLGKWVEDSFGVTLEDGSPVSDPEQQKRPAEAIREELVAAGC